MVEQLAGLAGEIVASNPNKVTTLDLSEMQHFNRNTHHLFFDLSQFIETIATTEQHTRFMSILSKVVPLRRATPVFMHGYPNSFRIPHHCGLTVYLPQPQFARLNDDYFRMGSPKIIFPR